VHSAPGKWKSWTRISGEKATAQCQLGARSPAVQDDEEVNAQLARQTPSKQTNWWNDQFWSSVF